MEEDLFSTLSQELALKVVGKRTYYLHASEEKKASLISQVAFLIHEILSRKMGEGAVLSNQDIDTKFWALYHCTSVRNSFYTFRSYTLRSIFTEIQKVQKKGDGEERKGRTTKTYDISKGSKWHDMRD